MNNQPTFYNDDLTEVVNFESTAGPVGRDTGHRFRDPKTNRLIGVIALNGESKTDAVKRVRRKHGVV